MAISLDQIYEGKVFGKPSIQLDPTEQSPATRKPKASDRETVINTYLPERFHTKKQSINETPKKSNGNSLKEKYESKNTPNIETDFINLLESYFSANRHANLNNLEEVMEDMYAFMKEQST